MPRSFDRAGVLVSPGRGCALRPGEPGALRARPRQERSWDGEGVDRDSAFCEADRGRSSAAGATTCAMGAFP